MERRVGDFLKAFYFKQLLSHGEERMQIRRRQNQILHISYSGRASTCRLHIILRMVLTFADFAVLQFVFLICLLVSGNVFFLFENNYLLVYTNKIVNLLAYSSAEKRAGFFFNCSSLEYLLHIYRYRYRYRYYRYIDIRYIYIDRQIRQIYRYCFQHCLIFVNIFQ